MITNHDEQPADPSRRAVWAAGLIVATGAGVATAHGLYQVACAAQVPGPIAWLYPLITDGLALVAYAATSRLADGGRRYAAAIVVLAAGLSGLAQAVYLAGGIARTTTAPVGLRFGVGAWPAIAAALTAHLLHLIGTGPTASNAAVAASAPSRRPPTLGEPVNGDGVQPFSPPSVQPYNPIDDPAAVQPARTTAEVERSGVQADLSTRHDSAPTANAHDGWIESAGSGAPARDRARHAARSHYARHGRLPTATELMQLAQVARGTAGTVLKDLRDNRPSLHLVNADTDQETN
jgi:hypothetical protein